ncbi:MAG: hypothetical protein AB7K37_02415 [Cyclobacteriaceae bacterium]
MRRLISLLIFLALVFLFLYQPSEARSREGKRIPPAPTNLLVKAGPVPTIE